MKNPDLHQAYLGLGSNLGNREATLQKAIRLIAERVGPVLRQSSFVDTAPWGFQSDNRFLNAVILVETDKTPRQLLEITQQIERDLGRRKTIKRQMVNGQIVNPHYADRQIDIDILLFDDLTVDEPDLKIPHPLMFERDFVMIPLREISNS